MFARRLALAFSAALLAASAAAQPRTEATPPLREARPGEPWITRPTIASPPASSAQASLSGAPRIFGEAGNQLSFEISATGFDAAGAAAAGWSPEKSAALADFLGGMLPVLRDLYGPPATAYTVRIVRDLRYTASALFVSSEDEIHAGDGVTYQLLTHELVHAFRRDRILSSSPQWQFEPTLSGFEEGFAQAVSYEAMTEFARRNPAFGLSQSLYQSSNEWDYDFQNVPELRTRDFWSDSGGMLLYWTRYEMAAAAIAKIAREHPGFTRDFNAEFYRRLNVEPARTMSRDFVVELVAAVAPVIEGRPAAAWIDRQYVFDCADHPGPKVWLSTQNYAAPADTFIFNRVYSYETFSNGSDWAHPNASGGWDYYGSNGSAGAATLRAYGGAVVWQSPLRITPTDNPPAYGGFGNDDVNLTTQASNLPWPGGDPSRYATNLLSLELYRLSVAFTSGTVAGTDAWRVIGAAARDASGVFGGVVGASGGTITLTHRGQAADAPVPVVNGAFRATPSWASQPHPETASVDSDPGVVDVVYVDAAGNVFTDVRAIGYGNAHGGQTFLFDVSRMTPASGNGPGPGSPPSPGPSEEGATLFHTLTPCRVFDSRAASGPSAAAPALAAGAVRVLDVRGRCGIPASAVALSTNVTVVDPVATGSLVVYPGDLATPAANTVSFRAGRTRANNTLLKLASDGSGTIGIANGAGGALHFLVDVNGYWQ